MVGKVPEITQVGVYLAIFIDGVGLQAIPSKVQSHSRGTEADEIARNALVEHGTYREHFKHVCDQIADDLEMIEEACKAAQGIG